MKLFTLKLRFLGIFLFVLNTVFIFGQEIVEIEEDTRNSDSNQYSNNKIPTSVNEIIYANPLKKMGNDHIKKDMLVILKGNGQLDSYDFNTLNKVWNFQFTDSSYLKMDNRFRVENAVLYATSTQSEIVALNINNGSLYWKTEIGFSKNIERSYMIAGQRLPIKNNLIYLASCNTNLYAFNKLTGDLVWDYKLQFPYNIYTPVIENDYLVIPNAPWVYCFEASSGKPLWQRGFGKKPMYALPQIDAKNVYVADENNKIYALSLKNNAEIKWEYQSDYDYACIDENSVLENGTFYFGANTGTDTPPTIIALNSENGDLLWKTALNCEGNKIKSFNKFDKYIIGFTNSENNSLYIIETNKGQQIKIENPKEKALSNMIQLDKENIAFLTKNYLVTFNIKNKTFNYRDLKVDYKIEDSFNVYFKIVKAN